jgi:hypothetical protein
MVTRAGLNLSATDSLGNQTEQSGGLPADGAPDTRTGRFGIRRGSIKLTAKHEAMIVRMKSDALEKARTLLATGKDMGSVCREINPEYASWGSLEQKIFQRGNGEIAQRSELNPRAGLERFASYMIRAFAPE